MLPPSEVVAEGIAVRGDVGSALAPTAPTIILVTLNVDGLGNFQTSASDRMGAVLTRLLVVAPDVLLLQGVTVAMYAVVRRRLAEWKVYRKHDADEDYFNVTAVKFAPERAGDKTTSFAFPTSANGRHLLTVRRRGWTFVNTHAESGGGAAERDERAALLLHMSRLHD